MFFVNCIFLFVLDAFAFFALSGLKFGCDKDSWKEDLRPMLSTPCKTMRIARCIDTPNHL